MAKKANPTNCLGCGRDTFALSGYCFRCIGHEANNQSQRAEKKDRRQAHIDGVNARDLFLDAEDDYSENSYPDSVYIEGRDLKHFQERKRKF